MPIIEFDTKMRGYDPQQVNDAVTNFQDTINKYAQANTDLKRTLDTVNNQFTQANQDIDQLQAENKKLSERIEELEKQNDDLEAKLKNKYTSVGDDVRKLLEDTQTVYHAAEKNAGGWCRFVGLVVDSITTNHATRPSSRRRSMMLMPNSVLIRLSRYQTM